jgi:hypothetical protein
LTYLSALGGTAYVCYGIYESRNPPDQVAPAANKKTLVVLGMNSPFHRVCRAYQDSIELIVAKRYWMGLRISPQKTRLRELQRHRYFSTQLLPLHTLAAIMHDGHYRASVHHGAYPQLFETQEGIRQVL